MSEKRVPYTTANKPGLTLAEIVRLGQSLQQEINAAGFGPSPKRDYEAELEQARQRIETLAAALRETCDAGPVVAQLQKRVVELEHHCVWLEERRQAQVYRTGQCLNLLRELLPYLPAAPAGRVAKFLRGER